MTQKDHGTNRFALLTLALLSLTALFGCSMENEEDQKLAAGLYCLDHASTTADANNCLSKVSGLESAQAYMIRCSANLIAQGFTGTRIASAFQKLKDTPAAGTTQSATMMSYFVFTNITNHTADNTVTNCQRSGSNALYTLANTAKFATYAASLSGDGMDPNLLDPSSVTFNPAKLEERLEWLKANASAAEKENIGNIAVNMQQSACGAGSSLSTQDFCIRLNAAVSAGGGIAANIGQSILNQLTNQ